METKISTKKSDAKRRYEAPVFRSMEVELEYGIASGSGAVDSSASHQWKETETQSQTVENNYW